MYCPECGNDAGGAKFCPECGADLAGVKDALQGKPSGRQRAETGGAQAPADPGTPSGRLSPAIVWGGFIALAAVVIVIVVMVSGGLGADSGAGTGGATMDTSAAPVEAVEADTSGSYNELIDRANKLYDKGDQAFRAQEFDQGSAYFAAAAEIYAAAWKKQSDDPAVGTDFAVALFYSGDIPGALDQIDAVVEVNPEFQTAWLNRGIFTSHEARIVEQDGDKKEAERLNEEARASFTKAVAIDPDSDVGKQAAAGLKQLPE